MNTPTRQQLETLRQDHIGRLFLRAHRAFNDLAIQKLRAYGHEGLGIPHTGLLANLDLDGTHITVLAERTGITKQAVGQLVADLEQKGYVERVTDPADRRASLIKFTSAGWQFLLDAHQVKREIEAEYTAVLGEERMAQLRTALTMLLDH
ncbi:MAG: winged helix-turn-helix transcriptional regulator [Anaerolineae bacterium]|nr:winged helix-turn-helix transcriptional regulator [Anaerolineae bacterium]